MNRLPRRHAAAGLLVAVLMTAPVLPAQGERDPPLPADHSIQAPNLHCRWNEREDGLVLDVWAPGDRFFARVLATTSERVLPASDPRPAVLHGDLVIASGRGTEGHLRLEIPAGPEFVQWEGLRLQGLILTSEGELLVTPVRALDSVPTDDGEGACGVGLRRHAVVYAGSPCNCTRPATFDFTRVRDATPEWRTILKEGIRPGSARYGILMQAMHQRLVTAARRAAQQLGCDLVVRAGDIADPRGKQVVDLTERLLSRTGGGTQ